MDLRGEGVDLGVPIGVGVVELLLGGGERFGEDGLGEGEEVEEGLEDGLVGGVGGDAGAVAAGAAVAAAAVAGVVAVGAGPAGGGGADVFTAAVGAGDQPGEVVLAGGRGALGVGVASGFGDLAGLQVSRSISASWASVTWTSR